MVLDHLRGNRRLVDEHEARRIEARLLGFQLGARGGDVRTILLGGVQSFLRNGDAGGWVYGLERKAEGLRSPMEIVNHPGAVSDLVGGRARVYIFHPVLHRVVEQHCDLARRGGHCFGLADARREPSVEGA
jgi:hypothetical protein